MRIKRLKKKALFASTILLVLCVLACILFAYISTSQLNDAIDSGNRDIVLNYANQVASRLHDRFQRVDISLNELRRDIELEDATTFPRLLARLEAYNEIWGTDVSGLLFEDGYATLADGTPVNFENAITLWDVLSYSEKLNLSKQTINGKEMLVFAKPCQIQLDRQRVTGVFAAMDIEQLSLFLGDYGYGKSSFLAITQPSGDNVWKQGEPLLEATGNCFEDLELQEVDQLDSVLQMKMRMSVSMDGTIAYTRDGQSFYLAYVPLNVNYWYLLVGASSSSIDLTELSWQHFVITTVLISVIMTIGLLLGVAYLIQRNHAMARHNKQLKRAMKLANQANDAKRDFLAKISHEIRTPLNGVIGMLALAEQNYEDKSKCLECLKKATISAEYLLSLLNDVLDISQIESGKQKLVNEVIDVAKLWDEVLAVIETKAKERKLSIEIHSSGLKNRYFKGDYLRLKQIITNLLSNAIKYTPAGGKIIATVLEQVEHGEERLVFKIQDNGEGIAKDKLSSIFNPFEQVSAQRQGGVGLGLSIVKSFVELMHGKITVESELGKGSTFTVSLPLVVMEPPKEDKLNLAIDLKGVSILLVEDNEINAEIATELLKSRGAKITPAVDGDEAVRFFGESAPGTFQAILMDIQMPKMNGFEATKEIRAMGRSDAAQIPIIAMTANVFKEQQKEMAQVGMNDFLYKPINLEQVCECIRKWVLEDRA